MITISLDEQGVFENNELKEGAIVMIAGIVYDDIGDVSDAEREKTRIKKYFELICKNCHAKYPAALHFGHGQDNKVKAIKQEYTSTLGEFLKKGTYKGRIVNSTDGQTRVGKYYVYALVKSRDGKPHLIRPEVSNLLNENVASNLYMHMVEDVLSRLLFYNIDFMNQEEVAFDLATRIYKGETGEDLSEHTNMGYGTRSVRDGELVFLTNSDVFRTALEREMLLADENGIDIQYLSARSINYKDANKGHEFLYLADAVCTCLGFDNDYGVNKPYLIKVWNRMGKLTGNNRLLFSYDAVDTGFASAWRMVENGDVYKALSIEFDTLNVENEVASFYKQVWEKQLFELILRKVDASAFTVAVRRFSQSIRNNNINQRKVVFIFEQLEKLVNNISFANNQDKAVLYEFYDAGVSAYNHIGSSERARECLDKCKYYVRFIGIEKEIRNRNKAAVGLCDSFKYQEAEKIVAANYEYYKDSYKAQKKIFGEEALYNSAEYGIVCSQLGQIYSYMCDERAEKMFHEALGLLEKGTPDYYITESYLLHYYLETKDIEQYEVYANEYFGYNDDLLKQLEYLIIEGSVEKNPLVSLKFAMYVYLKSIVTFYLDEISEELKCRLLNIEETISNICENGKKQINGHPWEITYKYLAIIAFKAKEPKITNKYLKKINSCIENEGTIIEIIKRFGELELSKLRSPELNIEGKIEQVWQLIKKENPTLKGTNTLEALEKIITYTYR